MLAIRKAEKFKQFARVCLWGVPKSGKTHSSLAIATSMVAVDGGKIAVISSEYGSSSLLARKFPHDIIDLTVDEYGNKVKNPFAPGRYEDAINLLVESGYQAIIIDSLSHAWEGEGGVLEEVGKKGKNSFSDGWGYGTPLYQHLINTILAAKAHIFITLRAKESYVVELNDKGRNAPRNAGLKPVIRGNFGFEMQLTIRMDRLVGHIEESAFQDEFPQGTEVIRPGEDVAYTLLQCLDGTPQPEPSAQQTAMRSLLDEFYSLSPATYAKIANWEQMALRKALQIESGPLPTDYTDAQVNAMSAYVETKKKPQQKVA